MAKLTLSDLANLQNEQSAVSTINANSDAIETALENTLSRDGTTPNTMGADLDMNSNSILNLPAPTDDTEPLRLGDLPDILPTIIVQDDEPATSFTEGSLWIDSNSADYDLYQLTGGAWTDTGVNIEGATGATGPTGPEGPSQDIFVQNTAPATDGLEGSLWIDADSTDVDLYQLQSAAWVDTTVNLKGPQGDQGDPWDQWQGAWTTSTAYVVNDAVENDGSSYICILGHTSGSDDDEPGTGANTATYWDLVASAGQNGEGSIEGTPTADNLASWHDSTTLKDTGIAAADVVVDSDIANMLETTDIGTTVQGFDADTLKADTADILTAGFATTTFNAGTKSSGTYTPDEASGNFQRAINGGAHTLAPPTNDCNIVIQYTNNASAGTVTTSGFTTVTGSTLTTTDGHDFIFYITKINGFSHLNVVALQ